VEVAVKKRVFISYSHADSAFVKRLADDLKKAGLDIWLDELEIKVGESILERVTAGIHESAYLIVVLSPQSVRSKWVRFELGSAKMRTLSGSRRIAILPVLRADCRIPQMISDLKWADFRTNYDTGLTQVLGALTGNAPVAPPAVPPATTWFETVIDYLRDPLWQGVAAVLALLSLLLAVWGLLRASSQGTNSPTAVPSRQPTVYVTEQAVAPPAQSTTKPLATSVSITPTRLAGTSTPVAVAPPTPEILYKPDFRILKNSSQTCGQFAYSPGDDAWHLRITCLHTQLSTSFDAISLHDFEYHVTATKISGSNRAWYGLMLTAVTNTFTSTHRFMLSGVGNWTYEVETKGAQQSKSDLQIVVPAKYSPAIRTADATNALLLRRQGTELKFYINDREVFSQTNSLLAGLDVTLAVVMGTQKDDLGGDDFVETSYKDVWAAKPVSQAAFNSDSARAQHLGGQDLGSILYLGEFKFWRSRVSPCVDYQYVPTEDSYHVRVKCLSRIGSEWPSSVSFPDFSATITATKISGTNLAWYGFILRSQHDQTRYDHRFLISGHGTTTYEVAAIDANEHQTGLNIVVPAQDSKAVRRGDGENLICLVRHGKQVEFWVNDTLQFSTTTSLDKDEQVQIATAVLTQASQEEGAYIEVAFKNFLVLKPP
jgi:hypothetical protein